MSENYSNDYATTLSAGATNSDTTISVASVTGAPVGNFRIKINSEIMLVTNISGTTLTVSRGQEGTTATSHSSADEVRHVLTAEGLSNAGVGDPTRQIYWYEECNFRTAGQFYNHGFAQSVSGTGAVSFSETNPSSHPGVVGLSAGSTTSGRACLAATSNLFAAVGRLKFGNISRIGWSTTNLLSDGTNRFVVWMGWGNTFGSAMPNSGILMRYTDDVNGGRWEAVCRNSGSETAADTGVTGDLTYHRFEIEVNAAGTEAKFWIDNALVATITTNIPTTALIPFPLAVYKTLGTSGRGCALDAFWYQWDLTTPR